MHSRGGRYPNNALRKVSGGGRLINALHSVECIRGPPPSLSALRMPDRAISNMCLFCYDFSQFWPFLLKEKSPCGHGRTCFCYEIADCYRCCLKKKAPAGMVGLFVLS